VQETRSYVVVGILPADVQERGSKVRVRHLQASIECPERSTEAIAKSRKAAARPCVQNEEDTHKSAICVRRQESANGPVFHSVTMNGLPAARASADEFRYGLT
jgi:hypothetical protein